MQLHVTLSNFISTIVRTLRTEALVCTFFFRTAVLRKLDSHTNTVISYAVAYSSRLLQKPWWGLLLTLRNKFWKDHILTINVELKVALTTVLVTVLCLLPLMALLVHVRYKGHISNVFTSLSRPWVQLVLVITCRNLSTALITHLYFWRLWVSLS